jgi:thiol-disulfide isomerase/thioredoxin
MHKYLVITCLLISAISLGRRVSAAGPASTIDWSKVIGADISKLTPEQKSQAETNLQRLQNTWGCKGSLAKCMAEGDITAGRHAGFVLRAIRKGKDDTFIAQYLALRHASAHPEEIADIDVAGHPQRGTSGAKVTLVSYECFQCPFCAHLAPQLKALEKNLSGRIVEYYKFFPVRSHPRGVQSALSGLAAHKQGKFWPMYDLLFANRTKLEDSDLMAYAKKIGLNVAKYNKDIQDPTLMKTIEKDKLEGMRFGVDGTPTFFVNGKRYQAQYDIDEIRDRIEEELDIIEGRIPK